MDIVGLGQPEDRLMYVLARNLRFPLWIVVSAPKVLRDPLIDPVAVGTLRMNGSIGSIRNISQVAQ